ncbi:MAG: arylesterase [Gammaproteobacteria bacterium]|nr:arylesterase [Gammaproteobacteria bacterium]
MSYAAADAADSSPPVLLVIGDSLSASYGMYMDEGWVSLLGARLAQTGHPHRIINASISGETSGGGLARLPRALERHQPALVILQLGGNDGLRGINIDTLRNNLARMIELSQAAGSEVILTGIKIPRNYRDEYYEAFESVYPALAEQFDIAVVDFLLEGVALDPELMQADGIHPNVAAQPRLLDNVWPAVAQVLAIGDEGDEHAELAERGSAGHTR